MKKMNSLLVKYWNKRISKPMSYLDFHMQEQRRLIGRNIDLDLKRFDVEQTIARKKRVLKGVKKAQKRVWVDYEKAVKELDRLREAGVVFLE